MFVGLDAVVVGTPVLPQAVPRVHRVVPAPVEGARAPDAVQLEEVRPVDARLLHVDEMRVAPGELERQSAGVVRPLVDAVVVEVRVEPEHEEDGGARAHDDAAARLRLLLAPDGAHVAAQFVERPRDDHVEVEVDAAVLGQDAQPVDVRVRRVVLRRLDALAEHAERRRALHHLETRQVHHLRRRIPS